MLHCVLSISPLKDEWRFQKPALIVRLWMAAIMLQEEACKHLRPSNTGFFGVNKPITGAQTLHLATLFEFKAPWLFLWFDNINTTLLFFFEPCSWIVRHWQFKNMAWIVRFRNKGAPLSPSSVFLLVSFMAGGIHECCMITICWTVPWPVYTDIALPFVKGSATVAERHCIDVLIVKNHEPCQKVKSSHLLGCVKCVKEDLVTNKHIF